MKIIKLLRVLIPFRRKYNCVFRDDIKLFLKDGWKPLTKQITQGCDSYGAALIVYKRKRWYED